MGLIAAVVAGAAVSVAGSAIAASAAGSRQDKLLANANRAGLDTNAITQDALTGQLASFGQAGKVASQTNAFNLGEKESLLETAMPGYQNRKQQSGDIISSYLRGEIPKDVQDQIQNSDAVRALGGGFSGAGLHRNLTARDFGLTSMNLMNQGIQLNDQQNSNTAKLEIGNDFANIGNLLGPSGTQLLALRSHERDVATQYTGQALSLPGSQDVWAKGLQDYGNTAVGYGLGRYKGGANAIDTSGDLQTIGAGGYT